MAETGFHVGVAVDGGDLSQRAFDAAACLFSPRADQYDRFVIIHVADRSKTYLPAHLSPMHVIENAKTQSIKRHIREDRVFTVLEDKKGSTLDTILTVSRSQELDYLAVGSFGRKGPKETSSSFGQVSDGALRQSHASLVIVKPSSVIPEQDPHILVCVDNSPNSWHSCDQALYLSKRTGAGEVTVLYVDRFESFKNKVLEKANKRLAEAEIKGQSVFVKKGAKSIAETIVDYATEHDVHFLVIGSTGHKQGMDGQATVGTVSGYCAHHAPMCTILVKPKA